MCALRNSREINPTTLATSYRFDLKPCRKATAVLARTQNKLSHPISLDTDHDSDMEKDTGYTDRNDIPDSLDDPVEEYDFDADDEFDTSTSGGISANGDWWLKPYLAMCKKLNRLPLTTIKNGLKRTKVAVKFLKLNIADLTSLCFFIKQCAAVKVLEFEDNDMGSAGAELLAQAIDNNNEITRIKIATNNLLSNGVKYISRAAINMMNLVSLDLSDNGIGEKDAVYLKELIEHSESIQELYLSKNCIVSEGIKVIANALMSPSCSLRILDLSWNHIRQAGARAMGKALEMNTSLEKLNLAWNGLNIEGAVSIKIALRNNDTLKELDLTCNRFSEVCIGQLMLGLGENTILETLHIGQNHMTCKGARTFLEHILENNSSGLKVLNLGKQVVDEGFQSVYEKIQNERELHVEHGSVHNVERKPLTSYDDGNDERALLRCNPLTVMMECMRLQNFRLLDMFKKLDVDNSQSIDYDELCEGMIMCGVPLKRSTILRLSKMIDTDGNGRIDYKELVDAHKLHQNVVRQYLQDGTKIEDTEIGRVSSILRRLMKKDVIMKKLRE